MNRRKRKKWVAVSMNCNNKINIRKKTPGVKISGLNQTVEMCGRMNNPSAKFRREQITAFYLTARHDDL